MQGINNQLKQMLVKRELARRNLVEFMKYKFEFYYNMPFINNWHYGYIAEYLEACLNGEIKRLIINEPPSYGKTEQIVKCFIPFVWLKQANMKFIYTTYGGDLTKENAQTTRDFIKSKVYANLGADFKIINDEIYNYSNDRGGRVYSTTLGSAVTGIHCNALIIDDPLKAIESYSKAAKDKVEEYYKGSLLSRLLNNDSFIIIIMQRLAVDDLVGRLESSGYTKICLKAINEKKEYYFYPNTNKLYYEREENEPLFVAKHNLENLQRIRQEMGELEFSTQMLQEPFVSEAGFFERDRLSFINDFDMPSQNDYIIIDSAESTSKNADDRAIVCSGISIDEERQTLLIVKDILHGKWELEEFCKNAITMMLKYPNAPVFIELAGGGITFHRELLKYINKANTKFQAEAKPLISNIITGFKPITKESKNHQIQALAPLYNTGFLKIKHTCLNKEQAIKELLAFDPSKKNNTDNVIDCIAKMLILDGIYPKDTTNNINTLKDISYRFRSKGGFSRI